jgi:hypothetical protein
MRRTSVLAGLLVLVLLPGCVYRRMTIITDPPGARLFVNNVEVGTTPCDVPSNLYLDHGTYKFTLFRDGFEPLEILQPVPPKPYQVFGIDFFSEVVSPFPYNDHRYFSYQMQPVREKSGDELKQNAEDFRMRGLGIAAPVPVPPAR